ncbi:MAG: hypothetical protein IPL86_15210 [Flavobacteriales bacterium]|nr:hypothetical protein [Flavobacteriales bacterium]
MEGLLERISAARTKVQQDQRERSRLRAASDALDGTLRDKAREAEVLKARDQELEQENEVLRTAKAATAAANRTGSKEKIDELVSEIDRCLALLNT